MVIKVLNMKLLTKDKNLSCYNYIMFDQN
jgi:hypothetical protein